VVRSVLDSGDLHDLALWAPRALEEPGAPRAPPPEEIVVRFLGFLAERGGKATVAALARRLDEPSHRVIGRVAAFQRLLNIEGYPILSRDEESGTVELNESLLREQFELR